MRLNLLEGFNVNLVCKVELNLMLKLLRLLVKVLPVKLMICLFFWFKYFPLDAVYKVKAVFIMVLYRTTLMFRFLSYLVTIKVRGVEL